MPEYLAPGVYVEETSFRSKSIEGVSTSTTAFVGPTRRGPVFDPQHPNPADVPELITSFADFQRVYGGLDDLSFGTNYLAHSVKSYFDNGGMRLYVSRVFRANGTPGRAASPPLANLVDDNSETKFVARMPGSAGNGYIELGQNAAPATKIVADRAPAGSILRTGTGQKAATPARLPSSVAPPYVLSAPVTLRLKAENQEIEIEIKGTPVEVAGAAIADPAAVDIDPAHATLNVTVDDLSQKITLPSGIQTADDIVDAINKQLRRGWAELRGDQIVIGSDRQGTAASVSVEANATLGFAAPTSAHGAADEDNNVGDLASVTADELDALINAASPEIRAALDPATNRMVLTSKATGETARVEIIAETDMDKDIARLFGFTGPKYDDEGESGATVEYFRKVGNDWENSDGLKLPKAFDANTGRYPDGAELLTLTVDLVDADETRISYDGLGFDSTHPRFIGSVLSASPSRRAEAIGNLFALALGSSDATGLHLRESMFGTSNSRRISFIQGSDGVEPNSKAYEDALKALEQLDDISIVAAPGGAAYSESQAIMEALKNHAEAHRSYRIAVLDTPPGMTLGEAREFRSRFDSKYAAMYYPWVTVPNPIARADDESVAREINMPPSGFVCGIYARNDVERGVFKAPANEIVRGALRFESDINFAQQGVLNPLGVNCLRFFPGRGNRVWGARTMSSDPEWKYVNIRRYFNYLERSIDVGTQWAVFEPNGERLWANITETIENFLYNEWVSGALLGSSAKEAFFVRCDRSTMTQNDLDNGRLICLVGVAAIKPAEFVIFRIGQKTAEART
jgi:hypothetical protein